MRILLISEPALGGKELKMIDIYNEHSIDTPYIRKNYKDALLQLEFERKITSTNHRKGTFGDNIIAKFQRI